MGVRSRTPTSWAVGDGRKKGRPKGSQNRVTTSLKEMILKAAELAGGEGGAVGYLLERANDPKTQGVFLALLGKILPLQVTGADGKALIPPGGITFVIRQQDGADNQT